MLTREEQIIDRIFTEDEFKNIGDAKILIDSAFGKQYFKWLEAELRKKPKNNYWE